MFYQDASHYANLIQRDELSVTEAVHMAFSQIDALNPKLNAVVHRQEDAARQRAKDMDAFLATAPDHMRKNLPPFFGVPILLKDLGENQAGQPSTGCSRLLQGHIATVSDEYIKAIMQAGFVMIGRSNAPEFGTKVISDAKIYGPVRSPIDFAANRNPGGSSGGAAAAVKSGMVPIATASDAGGSIRVPASYTGLIGLKPSRGRMPIGPGDLRRWQGAAVNFALTKSVRDAEQLLFTTQSTSTGQPFSLPLLTNKKITAPLQSLHIAYNHAPIIDDIALHPEAKKALTAAVHRLKALGHDLEEATPVYDGHALMMDYYLVNSAEMALSFQEIEKATRRKASLETLEPMTWAWGKAGESVKATDFSLAIRHWDDAAMIMDAFFNDFDLLMTPATNGPAPLNGNLAPDPTMLKALSSITQQSPTKQQQLIYEAYYDLLATAPFGQIANIAGLPAISLPLYQTEEGLPVGIQFMARKGREDLLLSISKELEDARLLQSRITKL